MTSGDSESPKALWRQGSLLMLIWEIMSPTPLHFFCYSPSNSPYSILPCDRMYSLARISFMTIVVPWWGCGRKFGPVDKPAFVSVYFPTYGALYLGKIQTFFGLICLLRITRESRFLQAPAPFLTFACLILPVGFTLRFFRAVLSNGLWQNTFPRASAVPAEACHRLNNLPPEYFNHNCLP